MEIRARRAGLKVRDLILQGNGKPIHTVDDLVRFLEADAGTRVTLHLDGNKPPRDIEFDV